MPELRTVEQVGRAETFFFTNGLTDGRQLVDGGRSLPTFLRVVDHTPRGYMLRKAQAVVVRRIEMKRTQQKFGRTLAALPAGLISIIERHLWRGVRPRVAVVGIGMATAPSDRPGPAPTLALIRSLHGLGAGPVPGGTR
jgi:hypothetical protein